MRETTRGGTGPVGNWSRRRSADERGGRRLVQQARYSHKNWTSSRGLHITNCVYDAANELVAVTYQTAQPGNVSYTYQADGRRLSMSDETGTTSYQYDSLGRVIQVTNGAGATVRYGYDLAGNMLSIAYPGGVGTVTRTYYANGWLHTVSDWLGHTSTYNYDPDGNLSGNPASPGIAYPNGVQQLNTTDAAERTVGITDGANGGSGVLGLIYTRDNANLLTGENTLSYGPYDPLNRLPTSTQDSYQYDAADRITQISPAGTSNVQTLSYDNADELTSAIVTSGGVQVSGYNYKYDSNGNRLSQTDLNGNVTSFTWDQANHLIGYSSPGIGAVYTYNGDGLRMSKTVGGGPTTQQTWDMAEGLPVIVQDGGNYYVTGVGGLPVEQIAATAAVYYHEDQLGSVRAITNGSGNVAETYSYDPYGNPTPSGSINQPFQYAGQYWDGESNCLYLRNRYYDPGSAQFASVDPLESLTWAAQDVPGPVQRAANRFYKSATEGESFGYQTTDLGNGTYRCEYSDPSRSPGWSKRYVSTYDSNGNRILSQSYKQTIRPDGSVDKTKPWDS